MADNIAITPGSGATIATDDVGGVQYQRVKLDIGGDGATVPVPGDATYGIDVDVTRVSGTVAVGDGGGSLTVDGTVTVQDGGGSLTVDAASLPLPTGAATETTLAGIKTGTDKIPASPATDRAAANAPFSTRLSDGTNFYQTNTAAQLPSALVGGRLDVNIGASAAVPVTDNGGALTVDDGGSTISVDDGGGALTVDGTVTANQGTAAAAAAAWPTKISDGTDTVGISTVSGAKALKVDVVQSAVAGQADKSGFTEGSGVVTPVGGVLNETIGADPTEDQVAALRITAKRGLHVNLRSAAGVEQGTNAAPVQVGDAGGSLTVDAPVGTPVFVRLSDGAAAITNLATNLAQVGGNAVATAASGIPKVGLTDQAGAAYGYLNPLLVQPAAPMFTIWRAHATYSASQTDIALITPNGGKRLVITSIIITVTTSGILAIYDQANSSGNQFYKGTPVGSGAVIVINFPVPQKLSAVNNILRYSTGASAAGDICVQGYEVDS